MRRVFVIGDSHTRALTQALPALDASCDGVEIEIRWRLNEKAGRVLGDMPLEQARERISGLAADDVVVISLLGTFHNIFGLLQHDEPYWLLPPHADDGEQVPAGMTLIPRHVMHDYFEGLIRASPLIDRLLTQCQARRFHLMTPPPKGDNAFIEARTDKYRERSVEQHGISSPVLRQRLWALEMAVLAEVMSEKSVSLIPPPPAAVLEDGFLSPACFAADATHANAAYGRLVLEQLCAIARQSQPTATR